MNIQKFKSFITEGSTFDTGIKFYEGNSKKDRVVLVAKTELNVKKYTYSIIPIRIKVILKPTYFQISTSFEDGIKFDLSRMLEITSLFERNFDFLSVQEGQRTCVFSFRYSTLYGMREFIPTLKSILSIIDNYVFSKLLQDKEKSYLRKKDEERATLNHFVNDRLLKGLEMMIINQIKERLHILLEIDKGILKEQNDPERFLQDEFFMGPSLIEYIEENGSEIVKKRLLDILFSPWETGSFELIEEGCKDKGYIYADVLLAALYYAFTGSASIDLNVIRKSSNIRAIETTALNYVIGELLEPHSSITADDAEELIEELQVINNISRGER